MKKLKEKIKEFKAKGKKEKLKTIINLAFLATAIVILGVLTIGFIVQKNKKEVSAGATVAGNPEITQTIYKTVEDSFDGKIYTIGYYDWEKTEQTNEYSVNQMEILVENSWKKIKSIKEVRTRNNIAVSFMYKEEEGALLNTISAFAVETQKTGIAWSTNFNTRMSISIKQDIKIKWDGVINYIGGRLQLYTEYAIPRVLMIYANVNTQNINQTLDYMNSFFESGYNAGYNEGYNNGIDKTFNPIGMIISPVAQFFSTPMFGSFAIGDFFTVAMFVSVALIFLKIFAGG